MTKRLYVGGGLLIAMFIAPLAIAQSLRPDISWLAGGHPRVVSVAYSPDGKILASSGDFGDSAKLWRVSDGRLIRTLRTNNSNLFVFGPMVPLIFFPDGQTILALGESAGPAFWNLADGRLVRKLTGTGTNCALNGDASLVAISTSSNIRLVRPNDGSVVRTIAWPGDFLQAVVFSRDGSVIAGGDRGGRLRTFRVSDGALLLDIPAHSDFINALAYSIDGTRIASASSDNTIKFWSATSGQPMGTLTGHTDDVNAIALSPDGAWLASSSSDKSVKLWSLPGGTLTATLKHSATLSGVSFNPASTRLAVGAYNELREYEVPSGALVRNFVRASGQISGTLFTPDSTKLVSASYDGKISISDPVGGTLLSQITATSGNGSGVIALGLHADMIAAGLNVPNVVNIYRLSDGMLLQTLIPGSLAYTRSAAFSPDGATLATGHFGNMVRIWNVADGSLVRTLNDGGSSGDMNGVAYTSDGSRIVAGSSDGFVRVWDAKGNLLRTMGTSGQSRSSIAISPDNQFVLAGGGNGLVQLWRINDGALIDSVAAGAAVNRVCFTPSGRAFYAVLGNRTLRVYRTADHQLLETYSIEAGEGPGGISGVGQITSIGVSPDGKYLAFGRDEATVVNAYNTLIAAPTVATAAAGQIVQGSFQDLVMPDGAVLIARSANTGPAGSAPLQIDLVAHPVLTDPTGLAFQILACAKVDGIRQEIWMRNAETAQFERVDSRPLTTTAQTIRIDLGRRFARFIDATGQVAAQVRYFPDEAAGREWTVTIDQAIWASGL